jgi:GxxExxY protein
MAELLFKSESYKIIGACYNVHKKLGPGFLESVYSEALQLEFNKSDIPYTKEKRLPVYYDGLKMRKYFVADFLCYDSILLELKATKFTTDADVNQTLNNLKATQFKLGLLINFGTPSLTYKRIVN